MDSDNFKTDPEPVKNEFTELRRILIYESIIFIIIGLTSYLSLVFLPRSVIEYLIGAILYGAIMIISGVTGLYGSYKVLLQYLKAYIFLIVLIALFNILAIVGCLTLFIRHLISGVPSSSNSSSGLTKFVYYMDITYYILQAIVALVLFIVSLFALKHTWKFYKTEKEN
jgi:hypothetical protein